MNEPLSTGADTRRTLRRAWPLLQPFLRQLILATAVGVAATVAALLGPQALRIAIDDGILADDSRVLRIGAIAFVVLAIAGEGLKWAFAILSSRAGERVLQGLRMRVFGRLLGQPLRFFESHGSGELLARNVNDVQLLTVFVRYTLSEVVNAFLLLTLGVVTLLLTSPSLAAVCLLALPLPLIALRWYGRASAPLYAQIAEADAAVTQRISEGLNGVDVTHATTRFGWVAGRLRSPSDAYLRHAKASVHVENRVFPVLEFNNHAAMAVVLVAGGVLVARGAVTVGTVVACLAYLRLVVEPLTSIGSLVSSVQEARVALARLLSIDELPDTADGSRDAAASGTLEVMDVAFGYDSSTRVLEHASLHAEPGQRIAIAGRTGAGKTTFSRIVAGLYAPDGGRVLVGGTDIRDLTAGARRRTVVLLPQGNHIFAGTVAENLRAAAPEASDEALEAAFTSLGLGDFLARLPLGLETQVGRGGQLLSSGERQLLGLVRLALRDPAVVILDESTSLIDPATEARLQEPLARLARDRVLLIVAHRPSTLESANVVYHLDEGRLSATT